MAETKKSIVTKILIEIKRVDFNNLILYKVWSPVCDYSDFGTYCNH